MVFYPVVTTGVLWQCLPRYGFYFPCRELRTGMRLKQTLDSEANIHLISIMWFLKNLILHSFRWRSGKESICQCRRRRFHPWVGKIPWSRKWQPTPVSLPEEFHGQKNLAGYSPWGLKRVRHDWVMEHSTEQHLSNLVDVGWLNVWDVLKNDGFGLRKAILKLLFLVILKQHGHGIWRPPLDCEIS